MVKGYTVKYPDGRLSANMVEYTENQCWRRLFESMLNWGIEIEEDKGLTGIGRPTIAALRNGTLTVVPVEITEISDK